MYICMYMNVCVRIYICKYIYKQVSFPQSISIPPRCLLSPFSPWLQVLSVSQSRRAGCKLHQELKSGASVVVHAHCPWLSPLLHQKPIAMLHLFSSDLRYHWPTEPEIIQPMLPPERLHSWLPNAPVHCWNVLQYPDFWVCVHLHDAFTTNFSTPAAMSCHNSAAQVALPLCC